jgi:nucleotide-binding universal stress UspA family protein
VLVRWAAQTLLRGSDAVVLLHAPYGLDEYHTLAAAGAIVDCEAMLTRFFRAADAKQPPPSQVRTLRLAMDAEPREALVAAVEAEGPFDTMLVGSRGMGAIKRAAAAVSGHGSVSSHLIAHAPCPVLVVSRSALLAWVEEAALPGGQQAVAHEKQAAEKQQQQHAAVEPKTPASKAPPPEIVPAEEEKA